VPNDDNVARSRYVAEYVLVRTWIYFLVLEINSDFHKVQKIANVTFTLSTLLENKKILRTRDKIIMNVIRKLNTAIYVIR